MDTVNALATYAIYVLTLIIVNTGFGKWLSTKYQWQQLTEARIAYSAANIVKSVVLGGMLLQSTWWSSVGCLVSSEGRTECMLGAKPHITHYVLLYCATDACQFFGVPMQTSTVVHHAITSFIGLCMAVFPDTFLTHPLGIAMLWYGLCSCAAFLVNLHLGLRLVLQHHPTALWVCKAAAGMVYLAELVVNWPIHTGLIIAAWVDASVSFCVLGMYVLMTISLMYDDLKLLSHLWTLW